MDYLSFERRLLRLMFRTNAPLTPVHVAYHLDLPIAEARAHLDHMVELGALELDSDDQGHLVYSYPMRPPVEKLPEPKPKKARKKAKLPPWEQEARHAMVPVQQAVPAAPCSTTPPELLWDDRRYSAAAAAALSFFLPGVGQIYSGRVPQGIGWMIATGLGYLLFLVPGLILHICCIVNAAAVPSRLPQLADGRR